jgi:hypothetical protein
MTVYGGFYKETCILPKWNQIYGSAGRACAVLSNLTNDITLNTFSFENKDYLTYFANIYNINYIHNETSYDIEFNYLHAFSKPNIIYNTNLNQTKNTSIIIEDESVICYGVLESEPPVINSNYAVFDLF